MGIGALWIKTPPDHPVLQMKLTTFNNYYNRHRTHSALNGTTRSKHRRRKVWISNLMDGRRIAACMRIRGTHSGIERKSPRRMRAIVPATPPRAARHQQASRQRGDNAGARQDIRIADGHERIRSMNTNNSNSTIQACSADLVHGPGNRSERKRCATVEA